MYIRKWIIGLLVVFVAGCAMVNVYITFPEEKIKQAAEEIEGEIEGDIQEDISFQGETAGKVCHGGWKWTNLAYAEEISSDIKTSSPVIKDAVKRRRSWAGKLQQFKGKGYVGESNHYTVEIRKLPRSTTESNEIKEIVKKENRERNIIIKELVEINNAKLQEDKFREIFAGARIKRAKKGEWIQLPNGNWIQKE